jgi:sensor histidine kinase YesM
MMKSLFPISFRSFRFSLLLYLLVIGAIPLLIAVLIFYQQTSSYIGLEHKQSLEHTHEQAIRQLQTKLHDMENITNLINSDFAIQQFLKTSTANKNTLHQELQNYLNAFLGRLIQQDRDLYALCLTFDTNGMILCSQAASKLTIEEVPFKSPNPLFSPILLNDQGQEVYGIRYEEALKEGETGVIRGRMIAVLNLSSFMSSSSLNKSGTRWSLQDALGHKVYNKETIKEETGNETISSDKTLTYGNLIWQSHMREIKTESSASLFFFSHFLGYTLLLLMVVSFLSSLLFSRYLMKPLLHLRGLMKRAELGDLKAYWAWDSKQEMNELGYSYNQMLNRIEDLIKQVKQEEALKKDAEMEALQYQLNPHFLYNTLNTIKWVAKIHKTPQISEVITALVLLLQSSLGKRGDFISLQEEAQLVEAYMAIQFFRYGDEIKVSFEMDDFAKKCLVPRLILQPLVENAIIHGIKPLKGDGIITIKAWMDRDLLFCEVSDNGVGMPAHLLNADEAGFEKKAARAFPAQPNGMKERMSGIGLRHIREKIKLYYGPDYKMHIFSKEKQGTTIRISLPIHLSEDYRIEETR